MNEPQPDIIKMIHETERRADQIIREAEAKAKALREEARLRAEEILKAKERELSAKYQEMLSKELAILEKEMQVLLETARDQAVQLTQRFKPKISPMVDRLLETVLQS